LVSTGAAKNAGEIAVLAAQRANTAVVLLNLAARSDNSSARDSAREMTTPQFVGTITTR
jgi:hypothetical protein